MIDARAAVLCMVADGMSEMQASEVLGQLYLSTPHPRHGSKMDVTIWKAAQFMAEQPGYCESFFDYLDKELNKPATYTL